MASSIWNQAFHPKTYIDGYGVEREEYISPIAMGLRAVGRFLNGPSEEEYKQKGMVKPIGGMGALELISPAGPLEFARMAEAVRGGLKTAKTSKEFQSLLRKAKEVNDANLIKTVNSAFTDFKKARNAAKEAKAAANYKKSMKIKSSNNSNYELWMRDSEIPDVGYFKGILKKTDRYKNGGKLKHK